MTIENQISPLDARAEEIMRGDLRQSRLSTDRLFAVLMLLQWLAAILAAMVFSPTTWTGAESRVHTHVWSALGLGFLLDALPVLMVYRTPRGFRQGM